MPGTDDTIACCSRRQAAGLEFLEDALEYEDSNSWKRGDNFASNTALPSYAPDTAVEPVHYDISLTYSFETKSVRGTCVQTIANRRSTNAGVPSAALSTITLNAVGFTDVQVRGDGIASWRYDGTKIYVAWEKAFEGLEERKVTVEWKVVEPIAGLYFNVPDKYYPNRVVHSITDNEPELCRYWLPCVDYPAVRTTLSFSITAPKNMVALANGALVDEKDNGNGTKTTRYKLGHLCPSYLICVCVGEFVSVDDGEVAGVPVRYFAPKNVDPANLKRAFGRTPDMLRWLPKKTGVPFPYPKYYQLSSNLMPGAMENISLVTWGEQYLMDEKFYKERGLYTEMTNIHEMAHSYFGDLLVIRHFEHVWLKESWASYFEALWLEENHGMEEFEYEMLLNAENYMAEAGRYMRPIVTRTFDSSWSMFDQHTYPGGAYRIHMLRRLLGDTAFWAGVQKYVKTYQGEVVETDLFRRCLEVASGLNLTKFFDQWFYSKGYPKLKGTFEYNQAKRYVQINFQQTQVNKNENIPIFELSLDVEVTDTDGKVYTEEAIFTNAGPRASVFIPIGTAKVAFIRVDPDRKVLHSLDMNPGEDILEGTARKAKDVANRVWAYAELIKIGTLAALKKVREAIVEESFHGVRNRTAAALSRAKTPGTLNAIMTMLKAEKDPRPMWSIVNGLSVRDEKVREALLEFLKRDDLPYRPHAAALENVGLQLNPADLEYLLSVAKDPKLIGLHTIVRQGALRALGFTRTPEAFTYLLSAIQPGHEPERARPAAISGLSLCARWQPPASIRLAIDTLTNLLIQERDTSVRAACISALADLEAKSAIPVVMATRSSWDERRWSRVEKIVKRLREGGAAVGPGMGAEKVKEVWKVVEELEAKVRKLEEKEWERQGKDKEKEKGKDKEKGVEQKLEGAGEEKGEKVGEGVEQKLEGASGEKEETTVV